MLAVTYDSVSIIMNCRNMFAGGSWWAASYSAVMFWPDHGQSFMMTLFAALNFYKGGFSLEGVRTVVTGAVPDVASNRCNIAHPSLSQAAALTTELRNWTTVPSGKPSDLFKRFALDLQVSLSIQYLEHVYAADWKICTAAWNIWYAQSWFATLINVWTWTMSNTLQPQLGIHFQMLYIF